MGERIISSMRFLLAAAVVTAVLAAPLSSLHVTEPSLCCGWADDHSNAALNRVKFTIQLRERQMDQLRDIALAVSDPRSPTYGNHLSQADIDKLTSPSKSDVDAVRAWLNQEGVSVVSVWKNRSFLVEASVAGAEQLLSTSFRRLRNTKTGQTAIRASSYTIPALVSGSVSAIFGLHGLPLPPKSPNPTLPTKPADVTPAVLASQYNIEGVAVSRSDKNRQAVAEFQGQTMNSTDLKSFFAKYVPDAKPGDEVVSKFVGDEGDKGAQVEASLDIQYIMGVAPGIKTEFWFYDPMDFCADLKKWTSAILSDDNVPLVHSVSYGWQGPFSQIGCTQANIDAVDADFVKLAAKGISIIFASGDSGSGYTKTPAGCPGKIDVDTARVGTVLKQINTASNEQCCEEAGGMDAAGWSFYYNDGHRRPQFNCEILKTVTSKKANQTGYSSGEPGKKAVRLFPSWPASSPWVTAVGATRFVGQKAGNEEMATDQFGSGGGFSTMFGQSPDAKWQSDDVANYLKVVPKVLPFPPNGSFPPQGRATPDISALGEGYQVFQSGRVLSVGGTSASAPAFAGIVSLLNEQRLNKGGNPLGFLNPFLYQNQDAFTDVTKGTNAIGRMTGPIPYGFNCTKGWDPATGIGTPKFDKLLAALN